MAVLPVLVITICEHGVGADLVSGEAGLNEVLKTLTLGLLAWITALLVRQGHAAAGAAQAVLVVAGAGRGERDGQIGALARRQRAEIGPDQRRLTVLVMATTGLALE